MKRNKLIRVVSCLLITILILFEGMNTPVKAVESKTISFAEDFEEILLSPGQVTHVQVPVKCAVEDYRITNVLVSAELYNSKNEEVSTMKINNLTIKNDSVLEFSNVITCYEEYSRVEFDVVVKETATIGQYYVKLSFKSSTQEIQANTLTIPFYINDELQPAELVVNSVNYDSEHAVAGNSLDLNLNIKNEGEIGGLNAYVTFQYPTNAQGEYEINKNYATTKIKLGDFKSGSVIPLKLPVKILETATKGTKKIVANFTYKDEEGTVISSTSDLYIDVIANETAPKLSFADVKYEGDLKVGNKFNVVATLKNIGSSNAKNLELSVSDGIGADSIIPDYTTNSISGGSVKEDASKKVTIPLKISQDATKGTKSFTITATYEDVFGAKYTEKTVVYIVVKQNEDVSKNEGSPNIIIRNVSQSPSSPHAGEQVTISFEILNEGAVGVSEFKLATNGLTANTFSPVSADPYIYFNSLASGEVKQISMTFDVSKEILEGYNTIPITYSYKYGENGTEDTKSATINVLDVVNEFGDLAKSVPKLIISDYNQSLEDLRAGEVFTFNYEIQNTHASVTAKNIKVTITQDENVFTVTNGSNSSYITAIQPGEKKQCSIELKVKSDAMTKAYPLKVTMAYEYDGAEASPVTGKVGEEVTEVINLQAVENSRPVVENVYLDQWTPATVGQSVLLYFQFYNMGKSVLSNVYATISGDFQKSEGEKQIIGNVNAGESQYVEVDVKPIIEGETTGIVTIYYEDSNGDELSMTQEFTATVMPDTSMNMDVPMESMPDMNSITAKKPILPVWLFVIIQVGILVIVTPVTRAIVIKRHKKKLEKAGEDM